MAAISSFLFGSSPKSQQLPLYSPEQQQAFASLRGMGQQQLQQNPLDFNPIEKRYTKQFEEQIIPGLAERFTAMGGGQRSSAFKGALGNVSEDLAERLAALRSQYNLQANQQGFNQLKTGLSPQFQYQTIPGQQGLVQNLISQLGQAGVNYFTGGLGNLVGGRTFHGGMQEQDPYEQIQNLFSTLNVPQSKIQQILAILGAA